MEDIVAQFEEADLLNEQLKTEKKQKEEAEVERLWKCVVAQWKCSKKRKR